MSCPYARDTDFASFAADPRAPEWSALREHYPRCAECGAEVARGSRLVAWLREEASVSGHPSEEQLLAYQSAPDSLAPAQRAALAAHLAGCAPCRSELRVLGSFDLARLAQVGSSEPERTGRRAGFAGWLFGRPLTPAFALAALLAVALPAGLLGWWLATRTSRPAPPPVARAETPAPEAPRPLVAVRPAPPASVEVARESAPPAVAVPPAPQPSAPDAPRAPAPPLPASPLPTAPAPRAEAPVQIAALLPAELPLYRPDLTLSGGSLESVRVTPLLRGGAAALPALHAFAPEHVGATSEAEPTVYWHLAAASAVPIEIAVFSEQDEATPLVEQWLEPPVAAGLHAFRFADHALRLAPGTNYYLFVALVPDREQRENDALAGAALRYTPLSAELRARLEAAGPARRAHLLAAAGYWFDAFTTFTAWVDAEPDAPRLRAQRAALLEQVGLGALSQSQELMSRKGAQ